MATHASKISEEPRRVLVVDDDPSTRLMVREVLTPAGFVVEEAEGGRKGLILAESFRPDVILLDIMMPEMDGFATLESLRGQEYGADCPVVMITGLQDPNAVESAFELGASDFVTKPINWGLLRLRLNYVLRSSKAARMDRREPLDTALRLAGVGTWSWDPQTRRLLGCDRFLELLGLRRREPLRARFALARVHPSDRRRVMQALSPTESEDRCEPIDVSFQMRARNGEPHFLRLRTEALQHGRPGWTGILQDDSERRRLADKLHGLQAGASRIQQLLRGLTDPAATEESE